MPAMNLKEIATTLAVLGSGALALSGCEKDAPATEVPEAAAAAGEAGEASCAADGEDHPADGHCGGDAADDAEGSCGAEKTEEGEGSCGAEKAEEGGEGSCGG